jgi:hypothetical protein
MAFWVWQAFSYLTGGDLFLAENRAFFGGE